MKSINTTKVDEFIGLRKNESITVKSRGGVVRLISPATVNRELRYIRAALRLAADWGFIEKVPRVRFLKLPQKLPTFVPPEHFSAMYQACEVATMPNDLPNVAPADWWRGLLVLLYMTGWRVAPDLEIEGCRHRLRGRHGAQSC